MERWQPSGARRRRDAGTTGARAGAERRAVSPDAGDEPVADTTLLDLLPHPAFVVAVDGDDVFRFIYTNDAYRRLLGDDTRRPATCAAWFRPTRSSRTCGPSPAPRANAATIAFEAEWGASVPTRRVAVDVTPIVDADGECVQLVGAAYDVSEHRRIEAELAHRTRHDPLTELPNRVMLVEWLQHALASCARRRARRPRAPRHRPLQGRERQPRPRSRRRAARGRGEPPRVGVLRAGDRLARLGGDELAVVCHNVARVDDVMTLAHRLRGGVRPAVRARRRRGVPRRERRCRRVRGRARHADPHAARRRRRGVRGQGARPRPGRAVRRRDARRGPCAGSRSRVACGARSCAASSACTTSRSSRSPAPR